MFEQYQLPFASNALEPHFDALTMETHHGKHHAAYTKTFNDLAQKAGVADMEVTQLLSSLDKVGDPVLRTGLRNNGGGFFNHNLYFSVMSPNGGGEAKGELAKKIDATFGSFEAFKEKISSLALTQFGSGWAWLSVAKDGSLVLSQSANQDNPYSLGAGATPIFCIDVWEHAYYLKFRNLRADYIKEFFTVVSWDKVNELYLAALSRN